MAIIRGHLKVNDSAKNYLITMKYQEKERIDITKKPTTVKLPIVALSQISGDASQYHTFMDSVVGMDLVVGKIEGMREFSTFGVRFAEHISSGI